MNDKCIKLICTLLMFIVLAGCEKNIEKTDSKLAIDPIAEKVTMPPEFAYLAIEQAGGMEAWGKVRHLQVNCIVTFFDEEEGSYLTEQKCDVYPWSDSITIAGTESREVYKWQLSEGKFKTLKGVEKLNNFKNQIESECYAQAILNLVTAPVRFMDKSFVYSRDTEEVNIQGRWYCPIRIPAQDTKSDIPGFKTIFYQNKADSLVDMILLTCDDEEYFLVCGYDYMEVKDTDISIPTRIEIHAADKQGFARRQLFRIDVP